MVAARAIDGAAHWIAQHPGVHRGFLYLCVYLERGFERLLGRTIGNQLDRLKQPASTDVADV